MTHHQLSRRHPVILGVATLDAIHFASRVELGFGGVCQNIACGLAQLGSAPVFISPTHPQPMQTALSTHFEAKQVQWRHLPLEVSLPFFEAYLTQYGEVRRERYHDNGAFAPLTPTVLRTSRALLCQQASLLIASTDLHLRSLKALQQLCSEQQLPFCLISSSRDKAHRLKSLRPDLLALNLGELRQLFGSSLSEPAEIARAAAGLVSGACLITLGPGGAILTLAKGYYHQRVPALQPDSTVGAGDSLFAGLIHHFLQSGDWSLALPAAAAHTQAFLSPGKSLSLPPLEYHRW
jgi:sugar/nucleoside kinase (ribokinase family)